MPVIVSEIRTQQTSSVHSGTYIKVREHDN